MSETLKCLDDTEWQTVSDALLWKIVGKLKCKVSKFAPFLAVVARDCDEMRIAYRIGNQWMVRIR